MPASEDADIDDSDPSEIVMNAVSVSAKANEAAPYRTRWLWFVLFVWNACSGSFMSLYYLAEGPLVCTIVRVLGDWLALKSLAARHWCLAACVVVGTIAFTLQAVHLSGISGLQSFWYVGLRGLAVATLLISSSPRSLFRASGTEECTVRKGFTGQSLGPLCI